MSTRMFVDAIEAIVGVLHLDADLDCDAQLGRDALDDHYQEVAVAGEIISSLRAAGFDIYKKRRQSATRTRRAHE